MKQRPQDVFTPRAHSVNPAMYISRPDLETALTNGLRGAKQIVVHGESGSGKSWLYKRVLSQLSYEWLVADLANASRFGSITKEFANQIDRLERARKVGYTETKEANLGIAGFGGGIAHSGNFELTAKEPFEQCLEYLRKSAGKRGAVIALDNFERIVDQPPLVKELADLISLTDNADYAAYEVKLVIVGVPGDLRTYFASVDQQSTIANRLVEVPEVARLPVGEVATFVARGLVEELGLLVDARDMDDISRHVAWVTDCIPQHLHEYCLELAFIAERSSDVLTREDLDRADAAWLRTSLVSSYTAVEMHMNSRTTAAGRRNQAIYAIGCCTKQDFRYDEIEAIVRGEFPESTEDRSLNIAAQLTPLSEGDAPLLTRTPKQDAYRLVSPKYRMCIRTMLRKDPSGSRVTKLDMGQLS